MPAVSERQTSIKESFLRNKNREVVGSQAFNLEYDAPPTRSELKRDIVSYLGEYRLQVQKYNYELVYGRERTGRGPITLRDRDRGEPLQHMAKRVIEERTRKNDPIHRETAEEKGLKKLNDVLSTAKTGDTVVWVSPPGPKEQGYGDYGFVYAGRVTTMPNGEAHVAMSAIRVENPTIEGFNKTLSSITGVESNRQKAEEFLESPAVIKKEVTGGEIDGALKRNFQFTPDRKEQEKFEAIISHMEPLIDQFLDVMEGGDKQEKLKAFYTLENYALKLKKDFSGKEKSVFVKHLSLHELGDRYSHRPPAAKGSCGSTGEGSKSNGLLSSGSSGEVANSVYGTDKYGAREFNCPTCGVRNVRPTDKLLANCQSCGSSRVSC